LCAHDCIFLVDLKFVVIFILFKFLPVNDVILRAEGKPISVSGKITPPVGQMAKSVAR
jgi:hypothetical protein